MSAAWRDAFQGSVYTVRSGKWAWKITIDEGAFTVAGEAGYASEDQAGYAMYLERERIIARVELERIIARLH